MITAGISARAVEMTFRSRGVQNTVLESLDLDVEPGGFVTLLGPSGCGKSTLLKILGGILAPTRGDVSIGSERASDAVRNKEIGLVLQRPALMPWKTARENVKFLRSMARKDHANDGAAADAALELVGLSHAKDLLPQELSGGMAQRVSIARALAMDPTILLMDEPFGALDAITRDEMNTKLAEIWQRTGKTVVFVTHSISEAVFLSDTVHVMAANPGRVVESLAIDLPRPRTERIFDDPAFLEYTAHLRDQLAPTHSKAA